MAARFWVGGTGTWDSTNTANWSATSGGAGGASVPGAADDVTINTASITVTTNYNVSVISVTINASAATLSLGGTLTCSGAITLTQGTFTTNNFSVTATQLSSNNSNTRTINLGSSTVTLSANSNPVVFTTPTGLTFNAGTSSIVCTGLGNSFDGGTGQTFYNVSWTGTAAGTKGVVGANTFNNLTVTGPASAGVIEFTFSARQTINGTLSTTGTAGNRRVWFRGATYGLAQTLTINSAPSLTDADFRDIYVIGTAAPISGTRIGDLRGIRGITASTPKTVYWNLAGAQNWSANGWATTSTGTPSTDNFPLGQDIATFTDAGSVTGVVTMDAAIPYTGTVDMSGRTSAMTLTIGTNQTIYGNWLNGSGTTMGGASPILFSGRNTQTITSAGKAFGSSINIDTYGGTVELADALNIGSSNLTVTNGTFDTKNYNVTAGSLSSSNSNVRAINLGSSTLTLSGSLAITTSTNLTFNAGTSQINLPAGAGIQTGAGLTFNNVSYTTGGSGTISQTISNPNIFNNLTVTAPSAGLVQLIFAANQTINGTLTVAGATAVRRIFLQSSVLGTTRTLTVNSLSAQDCDFRDITIAGTAAGSSPTRAGDCGGNTGITFPAAKTVYWNLAGAQNWSATAWAPSSGGTPALNNFPLAQDTAVFDNTGSVTGNISLDQSWNIGTFNASARTSAMTLNPGGSSVLATVYGNWLFGTGVSVFDNSGTIIFSGRGNQTITSNGVTFRCPVTIACFTGTVQLADALTVGSNRTLAINSGTFDAVTYNVTSGPVIVASSALATLKMGSGTWTLTATGLAWQIDTTSVFYKGTANIVLSDTTANARTFAGGGLSYNKLTIGGTTGTSTLTITGNNQFTELASTKTVAHTIALGTTTQTFGAWTVTGTAGNVVTLTGTAALTIAGAAVSGVDYLALGTTTVSATSPGEFYAGANSTATSPAAPLYLTAKPADSTRYWVGGTGNWSDTARWSTSSGGGSGASVPRSHDDVVFNSASNATAYTATVNAVTGGIRTKALTIAGPLTGNLTLAGSTAIDGIHGNVTLPATGLTRTYTGAITLSGSATGRTFTTNGVALSSNITVNGVNCGWGLGSALDINVGALTITNGSFDTANYNVTGGRVVSDTGNSRTIIFGSSTILVSLNPAINFGTTETNRANLTFTANTSQINCSSSTPGFDGNNQTFRNVTFTSTSAGTFTINGANTFNNLSFTGITSAGLKIVNVTANQTINGTLTLSAGTDATMRTFVQSNTIGTTRTLTCAAVASLTDIDFRDITIAGAAAPVSGTRLGDCKGNSGITFDAAKTVYWRSSGTANWNNTASWAFTDGGTADVTAFPLAQDTAVIGATYPTSGNTVSLNAAYNVGTIDMSARTGNTMTLSTSANTPSIYGNWVNGTGTTISGTGTLTFAGRGSQTITSAGKTFTQSFTFNTPSGSVTLQDALSLSKADTVVFLLSAGAFDANGYNVTLSATTNGRMSSDGTAARSLAIGSGTWTLAASGTPWSATSSLTVTGTGTISLTSASAKTFAGGGISYSGITLDQGGAGTLTISGNNTFANITNTYKATGATNITLGTTTQTVANFTASGEAGRVLTVQGTSASSPATLILTAGTVTTSDYLAITGVRAYNLTDTWYAGANSTNNGSLGWIFAAGVVSTATGLFFLLF
jgi:fibronectin-binding autotransporter adhesin